MFSNPEILWYKIHRKKAANFGFKTEMSSQLKWRDCQRHLPQVASLRPMHYKCGPVNNVMYRAATGLILERCVGNSL